MSSDTSVSQSAADNGGAALGAEAAEHERQFREMLEFCPAALLIVDEDGRLLFHNAQRREILGYSREELDGCETRTLCNPKRTSGTHFGGVFGDGVFT